MFFSEWLAVYLFILFYAYRLITKVFRQPSLYLRLRLSNFTAVDFVIS